MMNYTARFIEGDAPWEKIEKAGIGSALWLEPPPGLAAFAQLCYDKEKIKVRLTATESKILSRYSGILDPVCTDSCLEFFFSPREGLPHYFNFEFNPLGALCLGYGPGRSHSVRQYIPKYREIFSVKNFGAGGGWGVEYSIPLDFIRIYAPEFSLEAGKKIRGNFYKCGDETEIPHYLAWNKVDTPAPDFHRPEFFGEILFGYS